MDNSPYQVLGISPHKLYGRHHDLTKFLSRLHKARPEHISLVGHRGFGKSVFLRAVAEQAVNKTFAACIYWDLKRCSINSDSDFYKQFAIELAGPMRTIHPELAKLLSGQDTEMFETLNIVFETLEEESKTLLIILDGIDEILLEEGLSKNLWDHLRSLAERSSACFVTATRRRLRELLAGDSRTSPFWNIFSDTPTILSSFSDADWIEILAPFENAKIAFSTGARTELINWTGGVPLLVAALCRYVWQHCDQGTTLTNEEINEFGDKCYEDFEEYFQLLWDDCTEDQRGDFVNLVEKGSLPSTSMAARSRTGLKERGFIKEASATLKPSCRFMERYARDYGSRSSYIRLLFAADSDFENNIKSTLQLRFEQTDKLDSELRDYLRQSIDSLGKPVMVVNPIRAFANRIL
ncbi:ATP-binding protein, partial [Candidatus Obscuribacterales bacterium]|nr:ATP-binding protein [Candidatus Obscuribacterales bacterium]